LPEDITKFKIVQKKIKLTKPKIVIHAAAAKGAQKSNLMPKKYFDVNFQGTLNILEAMRINNIKNFVYISSSGFYRKGDKVLIENSPKDFNNPYSYGKYLGENIAQFYAEKYKFNVLSLRPNLISGNGLKQDNLIYDIINEIKKKQTATIFGKGLHIREFIHPLDISNAIKLWLKKKKKSNFEFYNITNNRFRVIDVVKRIIKFIGYGKIIYKNVSARVFSLKLSNKKIKKNLKWLPKKNLDFIIKDNYEQF